MTRSVTSFVCGLILPGALGLATLPAQAAESTLRLDHVTIFVPDLERAKRDFAALGFTVHPGGTLPGGYDHNAIIPFADGTYLELFAPIRPGFLKELRALRKEDALSQVTNGLDAIAQRFVRQQAAGPGLGEFALSPATGTFPEALAEPRERGLALSGPMPMVRTFASGGSIRWQIGVPSAAVLPFLISRTPAHLQPLRLCGPPPYRHANGATGIARVTVLTDDWPGATQSYRQLLGEGPAPSPTEAFPGTRNATFALPGATSIVIAQPTARRGPLAAHLRGRGPGIYAVALTATGLTKDRPLNRARAGNARITLIPAR